MDGFHEWKIELSFDGFVVGARGETLSQAVAHLDLFAQESNQIPVPLKEGAARITAGLSTPSEMRELVTELRAALVGEAAAPKKGGGS